MISRGETIGTFQIESRAQIASILHTKPERLYDIVVQVALIRPGPIQARFVHPYTQRRRGMEEVTYLHPALEPILARTQGIPIFQEQAMAIAMALGGYSAAEADLLRRTMGHQRKKTRLVQALDTLRQRLIGQGIEPDIAERIEEDLLSFANYGFPESHAWSFALIAYATAFLKAHYPTEFTMAILNAQPMGFYPVATLVHDAKRAGVVVVGPCLRDGLADCTVEPVAAEPPGGAGVRLRIGWRFVRSMGDKGLDALTDARALGPFLSIGDVVRRARLGRADAIALARSGAFGAWEPDRRRAAWEALRQVGDTLPLAPSRAVAIHPRPLEKTETVFLDYFATGMSLAGHPMEHLRGRLGRAGALSSRDLGSARHGEQVMVAGLVVARQRPESANGVMFILLEDEFGFLNAIVRKEVESAHKEVVRHSLFLLLLGTIQRDGQAVQILAERLKPVRPRAALAFKSRDFR
jgi:error-prone DNA polymerase